MALEPLGHRVLVEVILQKKTESGIILAHDERFAKAAMESGYIRAIGPEAWKAHNRSSGTSEPWAKIGDRVVFSKYGGKIVEDPANPYPENNEDVVSYFMVLNDEDILCKVA